MFLLTETLVFTVHAVVPGPAHPVPALRAAEPRLTHAAAVDVEAAHGVCTVAHTFTVLTIGTCRALLVTPVACETFITLAVPS